MKKLIILLSILVVVGAIIFIGIRFWFASAIASLEKCQAEVTAKYKLNEYPDYIQKYNSGLISKDEFDRIDSSVVNEDAKCFDSAANKYHIPADLHKYHSKLVENVPPPVLPLKPIVSSTSIIVISLLGQILFIWIFLGTLLAIIFSILRKNCKDNNKNILYKKLTFLGLGWLPGYLIVYIISKIVFYLGL